MQAYEKRSNRWMKSWRSVAVKVSIVIFSTHIISMFTSISSKLHITIGVGVAKEYVYENLAGKSESFVF